MGKHGPIASCYECAGIQKCYGSRQPGISRDEGRAKASACDKLWKGRTTEVVKVEGRDRGMSRKNAQEAFEAGEAEWAGPGLIRLLDTKGRGPKG